MSNMTAVSCFAGIAGFDVGFARAGITVTDQIEIDAHCSTILRRHYPDANLLGDITDVSANDLTGIRGGRRPSVYVAGFPCQDTSIAAPHRSGIVGRRSHHYFEFTRLVEECGRIIDQSQPQWVVLENPTGLLKSNKGRDMATVVGTLEECGYGWAYRVVNSRYLGTCQRRARVIVVGYRGNNPGPAWAVLGDNGHGGEIASPREIGRGTIGPVPNGNAGVSAIWRKSARARASLDKGGYETWVSDGNANTLTGFDYGNATRQTHLIAQHGKLRTLTLTEWERLQGFPDNWTAGIPESARATALGNAMFTGMAEWLGRRLATVHGRLIALPR